MVRLEENDWSIISNSVDVSIPIWCDWKLSRYIFIRIGIVVSIPIWCDWKCRSRKSKFPIRIVSIPIWCDWKESSNSCRSASVKFQFLYGAIGSLHAVCSVPDAISFNSYMVRLEASSSRTTKKGRPVSIPIWCDWKLRPIQMLQYWSRFNSYMVRLEVDFASRTIWKNVEFQFLYGAIGSLYQSHQLLQLLRFNSYMVRLEEWFFFRSAKRSDCFNSYMVRLEDAAKSAKAVISAVSIPIWCDWKVFQSKYLRILNLFQFLYGAIGSFFYSG